MKTNLGRQSNFEFLRILAMIMIVAHHYATHGIFNLADGLSINKAFIYLLQMGGKIGVNIFVMITGYFLVESEFNVIKSIKLWLQIVTYSLILNVFSIAIGNDTCSIKEIFESIIPVSSQQYWFASTYFILYIISPFINIMLKHLSRQEYKKMLIILAIAWCVIPTFTNKNLESNTLTWFVFIYSVAGYIRLWGGQYQHKTISIVLCAMLFCTISSAIVLDTVSIKIPVFDKFVTYFYGMQKLPVVVISMCIFVLFRNIKCENNKVINTIAQATFGVYLLHDNWRLRGWLYENILHTSSISQKGIIPTAILSIIAIYIFCTVIELCRIYFVEKKYMIIISQKNRIEFKLCDKMAKCIKSYFCIDK